MSYVLDTNVVVAALNGYRPAVTKSDADLLIAATAIKVGGILVTDDQALHDGSIAELQVENWISP